MKNRISLVLFLFVCFYYFALPNAPKSPQYDDFPKNDFYENFYNDFVKKSSHKKQ